jgi:excisionase family DNA binding protein
MAKKYHRKPVTAPRPAAPVPDPPEPVQVKPVPTTPAILLSVSQVCEFLGGISRSTLVRMEKTGKIPGRVQLGGSVRYHREVIESWVRSLVQ